MTKTEIINKINNLKYFTEDLIVIKEAVEAITKEGEENNNREELYKEFVIERDVVNRLLTIERWKQWVEGCKKEFYKPYFKEVVTNPNRLHNIYTGVIPHWGMKMTEQEFDMYAEIYEELFELN